MSMACRICVVRSSGSGRRSPPGGSARCRPGSTTWGPSSVGRHWGGWGFSPAEMALPNHPRWPMGWSGPAGLRRPVAAGPAAHLELPGGSVAGAGPLPHRLAVVKPQGSNTKLVGQLHPHHQAKGRATAGCWPTVRRPPLVTRSPMARTRRDNAPVPPSSLRVVRDYSGSQTPMRNLTQYLEQLVASGTQPGELAVIPAAGPAPHLAAAGPGDGPDRLADHLDQPRLAGQPSPHQGGGSWTGELSWVGGDDQVLSPWRASWLVHQQIRLRGPCRRPPPPSGAVPAAGRPDQPLPLLGRGYLDQPRHRTGPWHHPA
jgi:hypothetical protein